VVLVLAYALAGVLFVTGVALIISDLHRRRHRRPLADRLAGLDDTLDLSKILGTYGSYVPTNAPAPTECTGFRGYSDMQQGAQVVVKDGSGNVIGTSQLGTGALSNYDPTIGMGTCTLSFAVDNLPDVPFYSVEVSHRGAQAFSKEQLDSMNWSVAFTLGGV
jgi:hypothetical protein